MSEWDIRFKGTIWTLEQQEQQDGRIFELARRTPGVRIMLVDNDKLLLNRESRHELAGSYDLRLPGGKVFDSLEDWLQVRDDPDELVEAAVQAAAREMHEECGVVIEPSDLRLLKRDINGGKGEWDLYYFHCSVFQLDPDGPAFSDTEAKEIDGWSWFDKEKARSQALDIEKGMSESRSARYVAAWADGMLE
ncbi:MAG: NUDIX hydrolase [Patescibacteria group bacterium]